MSGVVVSDIFAMAAEDLPYDAPALRLCCLRKWSDFHGYGFNLHAEKGKAGQFIGKVDANSPSDAGGLRENDRVIEVNGVSVGMCCFETLNFCNTLK